MSDHFKITDTAPLMNDQPTSSKKVWVNFLPNIDLGHLLTMIGFAIMFAAQWNIQDRRITTAELQVQAQEKALNEIKGDIKEIKSVVLNVQLQQAATNAVRAQVK